MQSYSFTLKFELPNGTTAESHLDALYKAGCHDAIIGLGKPGIVALDFERAAISIESAIESAMANVKTAIPAAIFVGTFCDGEVLPSVGQTSVRDDF